MLWLISTKQGRKVSLIGFILIALVVVGLLISRAIANRKGKKEEKEIEAKADAQGLDTNKLFSDAQQLVEAFGFDSGWLDMDWGLLDWTTWTEDETTIIFIIREYNAATFPLLSDAYRNLSNRNLRSDLNRYLSTGELEQISEII